MCGLGGAVALLHALGWGLFVHYSRRDPALAGLGTVAYTLGLRHAFDVDHVAAIDNTTRKLLQDGRRPLGVGFFFSLGHSTVVFSLTVVLALTAGSIPSVGRYGGPIGVLVSGTFLLLIGLLNLVVLADAVRVLRQRRDGCDERQQVEQRPLDRGLMSRVFLRRLGDRIDRSWKMLPLGVLFGLGFDTATEIALLAVAAGVATHHVPFPAIASLPLLFAAGMSLLDTADGVFMSRAYGWAFSHPVRRVYYNLTVTSLSVAVALAVGTIELLQVTATRLSLDTGPWGFLAHLDFSRIGDAVVGLFVATWAFSAIVWRTRHIEERRARPVGEADRGPHDAANPRVP